MSVGDAAGSNPEGYPIKDAFDAIDIFSLGQEGEPQLITFGDQIKHFSLVAGKVDPHFGIPYNRTPVLISTYESLEQMAIDLRGQSETNSELFKQRVQMLVEQGVLYQHDFGPPMLPRTTAEEEDLDMFEGSRIGLDEITEAAKVRSAQHTEADTPSITLVNLETGQSKTITLDVSKLIADGELLLTRGRKDVQGLGDATISTYIELGELFKQQAAALGIDIEDAAMLDKFGRREELYPADNFFGRPIAVSNDFWSEKGEVGYQDADEPIDRDKLPRHSLYNGGNYRRVNSYDASDFLDTAQAAVSHMLEFRRMISSSDVDTNIIRLQPLRPIDDSFHALREAVDGIGFDLGYSLNARMVPVEGSFSADYPDGRQKKFLHVSHHGARLGIENALRAFDRWQTPIPKRIGQSIVRKARSVGTSKE